MKNALKLIVRLGVLTILLTSCGVDKVYTSASYGAIKTYTEKPIYKGKKKSAIYGSGSLSRTKHLQYSSYSDSEKRTESNDKAISGDFSIYRVTTDKNYNFYYGVGGSFGTYHFNSDLQSFHNDGGNIFSKGEQLNYYYINLRTGINYKKTWKKMEFNFIGIELIYVNEFGPYIEKLSTLSYEGGSNKIPTSVVAINAKSIFAVNLNQEITYVINKNNKVGLSLFFGNIYWNDKNVNQHLEVKNATSVMSGFILNYNYKNFTINFIKEEGRRNIGSSRIGLAYKIF